jgi:hypothetical protein
MFVLLAIGLIIGLMWYADRTNGRDRKTDYDRLTEAERMAALALHSRQDLKTIAFLLAGIMVLLGVIADRM